MMRTILGCFPLILWLCQFSTQSYIPDDDVVSGETKCQCVPPHLCSDNDSAANGHGLLDIRFEGEACPNYYEVCCELPVREPQTPQWPSKGCGVQNSLGVAPRITSSSDITQFGELPWTTLVLQRDRKTERNAFICGGSLIHPQVVITAGHCVYQSKIHQIKVRVGEWNVKSIDESLPHQDRDVDEVLVHPNYKPGILWNDIGLLFLSEPFVAADNIGFICLPPAGLRMDSAQCIASGWGKNAFQRSQHSSVLRKVTLPIVPRNKCLIALRNTKLGKLYKLHRSFMCAGGKKNKDTCKGDGGSPLICPIPGKTGKFVQMGIVSWGIGCGNKTPGVYVNLPLYTNWIDNQLILRNLSTTYYKY